MPLKNYGVWVGYPRDYHPEKDDKTPHLQLYFTDNKDQDEGKFNAAINIKSSADGNARLAYWFIRDFRHPITQDLDRLEDGWHDLIETKEAPALDYIRGNLFNLMTGTLLDHNLPGEKNDIIDLVSPILDEAIKRKAKVYLYGEQFGGRSPDGLHDVHMNQGNEDQFAQYNGVFQDGGVLFQFPDDGHWEAIFLAFAVQKIHTDDESGEPITEKSLADILKPFIDPTEVDRVITIRAALINPVGHDETPSGQREAVHLFNTTSSDINLDNWSIVNRDKKAQALSGVLRSNQDKAFAVPNCPLTNQGGTITLLNADGLKVDGVSYTKAQAKREGRLISFQ